MVANDPEKRGLISWGGIGGLPWISEWSKKDSNKQFQWTPKCAMIGLKLPFLDFYVVGMVMNLIERGLNTCICIQHVYIYTNMCVYVNPKGGMTCPRYEEFRPWQHTETSLTDWSAKHIYFGRNWKATKITNELLTNELHYHPKFNSSPWKTILSKSFQNDFSKWLFKMTIGRRSFPFQTILFQRRAVKHWIYPNQGCCLVTTRMTAAYMFRWSLGGIPTKTL